MVDQFKLSTEAIDLKLSMDGFELLPQSITKDLLRDGDLVILKGDSVKKATAVKKRKSPVSPTEFEKDDALDTRPVKKTKKSKSSITPTTTTSKTDVATKDKVKEVKTVKKKGSAKTLDKKKDQKEVKTKSKKDSVPTIEPPTRSTTQVTKKQQKQQSSPFEGLDRTKKRNMRKKLIKQRYRMLQEDALDPVSTLPFVQGEQAQQPIAEQQNDAVHELQVENLRITLDEPSEKLLKKNKNKKKNHLKGSKAENRSHVYYQAQEQEQEQQQQSVAYEKPMAVHEPPSQNLYGRAFITSNESEPKYKGYRMPENHLPIHQMPTLFYATNPNHQSDNDDELVSQSSVAAPMAEAGVTSLSNKKAVMDADAPIDYEKLPVADFLSNIPSIGDQLAIKTLELTANYTPEISDWKQVILKAMDLPNTITFVYVPGFGKTSTKGGKFDIKKHQKKRYDDYYDYEEEQQQEQEEQEDDMDLVNEDEQEQDEVTMSVQDVYAVKNMSKN
ncbi:hypothetical protein MAM1_0023c01972 [Mucor ambiguus]|uniref:Coilin tudor domain-containing protein n=1 Tax=Mucor ambiguus TaxID=91626 RepID=A0A0C9MKY5_9FUNG|nr:hypothetical protein MAM1_0023c01972 [Mucor ambiguus]